MIYITGDTHGQFDRIVKFCRKQELTQNDKFIILGDVGLNYYLNNRDVINKLRLAHLKPVFISIAGNHEERPENIKSYQIIKNDMGNFYYEPKFPNILFCIDSEVYNIENTTFLCLGGAYSVDKFYRLAYDEPWFKSEQMSDVNKNRVRQNHFGREVDYILAHTCPYRFIPREMFIDGIEQTTVDNSMEHFLDECYTNIKCKEWFVGHWHTNKSDSNIKFLFEDIISVPVL